LNVAQRFSAGITGKEEKEAREAGDRMSVSIRKVCRPLRGLQIFFRFVTQP
jgi:hypothetical protein